MQIRLKFRNQNHLARVRKQTITLCREVALLDRYGMRVMQPPSRTLSVCLRYGMVKGQQMRMGELHLFTSYKNRNSFINVSVSVSVVLFMREMSWSTWTVLLPLMWLCYNNQPATGLPGGTVPFCPFCWLKGAPDPDRGVKSQSSPNIKNNDTPVISPAAMVFAHTIQNSQLSHWAQSHKMGIKKVFTLCFHLYP